MIRITWNDDFMTAEIRNAPLGDVLKEIKQEKGLQFTIEDSLLKERVSVSFKNLEFTEGMKRILKVFSYSLVYNKEGSLKKVNVLAVGDPDTNLKGRDIPVQAPYPKEPETPDDPAGPGGPVDLPGKSRIMHQPSPAGYRPTPEELEAMNPGAGEPPEKDPGYGKPPETTPGDDKRPDFDPVEDKTGDFNPSVN